MLSIQNAITTQFSNLGVILLQNLQQAQMSMLGAVVALAPRPVPVPPTQEPTPSSIEPTPSSIAPTPLPPPSSPPPTQPPPPPLAQD